MPNLTALTASVSSAWTDNESLFLYALHDDTDYRVSIKDLTDLLGMDGGCTLNMAPGLSVVQDTNQRLAFGSVFYESGAGWQDLVNSATLLIAPFTGIVQLSAEIRWTSGGKLLTCTILHNNTFNNTPFNQIKWEQNGTETHLCLTHPFNVVSGDNFSCVIRNGTDTSSIHGDTIFSIWPMGWT